MSSQSSELNGSPPTPLMIQNQSHKIAKSTKEPVIIYVISPKVIHAEANEFMALVQRLTGKEGGSSENFVPSKICHARKVKNRLPMKVKTRVLTCSRLEGRESASQSSTRQHASSMLSLDDLSNPASSYHNWILKGDCVRRCPTP